MRLHLAPIYSLVSIGQWNFEGGRKVPRYFPRDASKPGSGQLPSRLNRLPRARGVEGILAFDSHGPWAL